MRVADASKQIISFDITVEDSLIQNLQKPDNSMPVIVADDIEGPSTPKSSESELERTQRAQLRKVMLGQTFSDSPLKNYDRKSSPEKLPVTSKLG